MKKFIIIIIIIIFSLKGNAQMDTIRYGILDITPEAGLFFPKNENFQTLYNAKTCFTYSISVNFGKSTWVYQPWFRFTGMRVDNSSKDFKPDSVIITATKQQYTFGIMRPYRIRSNDYIQLKLGLTYNEITETTTNIADGVFGFVLAAGYLHRIDRFVSYHIDLGSDFVRVNKGSTLRDWSGFRLDVGISINLGVSGREHPVFVIP